MESERRARRLGRLAAAGSAAGSAAGAALIALAGFGGAQAAESAAARFATQCAPCHGAQGDSAQPLTPSLGGQPSFYAITQLFLFREGRRSVGGMSEAMTAVAKTLKDDDLRAFSEHVATLPPPPAPAPPDDMASAARGAALAAKLHCSGCHGADFSGGKQVPRLAGQREDYLLHALKGFRAAQRVGYTPAMTEALAGVDAAALEDLAHFLAHFPASAAVR